MIAVEDVGFAESGPISTCQVETEACAACETSDGCEAHRLFTCATCRRRVPWSTGGDDECPNDCSNCWAARQSASALVSTYAEFLEPAYAPDQADLDLLEAGAAMCGEDA